MNTHRKLHGMDLGIERNFPNSRGLARQPCLRVASNLWELDVGHSPYRHERNLVEASDRLNEHSSRSVNADETKRLLIQARSPKFSNTTLVERSLSSHQSKEGTNLIDE